jgi:hypothetical protein
MQRLRKLKRWISGKKPKFWGKISRLMLKGKVTVSKVAKEMQTIRSERRGDCGLLSRLEVLTVR